MRWNHHHSLATETIEMGHLPLLGFGIDVGLWREGRREGEEDRDERRNILRRKEEKDGGVKVDRWSNGRGVWTEKEKDRDERETD